VIKVVCLIFLPLVFKAVALVAIPTVIPGSEALFWIFIVALFIPEGGFIFSASFRHWLKDGVEDGDGVMNKSDLTSLISHYATAWCVRLYVLFGLVEVFYGIHVRESIALGTLGGAFGIEGMVIFKKWKK
jgi:hypothetical protein